MKTVFYLWIALFVSVNAFAQPIKVSSVTVGTKFDLILEPIVAQAEQSRSQTIYLPSELAFRGTINSIKYFTEFSSSSFVNSATWRVKIGVTDKTEFVPGDSFISDNELTEVFNGKISVSGTAVILTLNKSFYYNGQQNLVIDVEELEPGKTTSSVTVFTGVENFNNPPRRTRMTMTGEPVVYENSYPCTEFGGDLENCGKVYQGTFTKLSPTSVLAAWPNPHNATSFRYNYVFKGESTPTSYQVVSGTSVQLDNLQPATDYKFLYKIDCDIVPSTYSGQYFTTDPAFISVPTSITFDGAKTYNYFLEPEYRSSVSLSPAAAVNSENGILFSGGTDASKWSNASGDPFTNNPTYISSAVFNIDLTNYAGKPVFQFDLRQTKDSKFRVVGIATDHVYTSTTPDSDDFKTVTVDLSKKIGTQFKLTLQHLGKVTSAAYPYNTAFVDNIKLVEADCLPPADIVYTKSENTITLVWTTSPADQWEVAWSNHGLTAPNSGTVTSNKLFTITDLLPARSYDVYIRSKCGNSYSYWRKIIISTKPATVKVPYQETFTNTTPTNYAPEFQGSSRQIYHSDKLIGYQINNGDNWVGGTSTTEQQAWNDNKPFISGITFFVDATDLSSLNMAVRLKQQYYFSQKTSWFRVLVNGIQQGASRNPSTAKNDPYQTINYNLTSFVGNVVEVTLQHCGRDTSNFSDGNAMDVTRFDDVLFSGLSLDTPDFSQQTGIRIFPNPTEGEINFDHSSDIDEITVSDLSGKIQLRHKPKEAAKEIKLNIASLPTGTFIAKVKSNGGYQYAKIIRQ